MFLPINKEEIAAPLDFICVTGDAYVDHPSFGHAIISRVLEAEGFAVGIIAQPNWRDTADFMRLGEPKLAFLVTSGNIDSMVNHYTASKKPRKNDLYSPGGRAGMRPDRAVIVYCNMIRRAYPKARIIIGGIEASLRRFAHYDYWDNKVRRSILFDSRADVLVYGMGEHAICELANALKSGLAPSQTNASGCCYVRTNIDFLKDYVNLPSFDEVLADKKQYAIATAKQFEEQDPIRGKPLVQMHGDKFLVQNLPALPLKNAALDNVYNLKYERNYHPIYEKDGGIPALAEVKFSITNTRGCYGTCNFCALAFHQGRNVTQRTEKSVLSEAKMLASQPDFKGYIHDVGGPTANFSEDSCDFREKHGTCKNKRCLYPSPCKNLKISHAKYLNLLRKMREIPNVKKVFIRSGVRFDYLIADKNTEFFTELCKHHVSGQLKVAPEHVSRNVLCKMSKPGRETYDKFAAKFYEINKKIGKEQYLVPYLMSGHPGSTLADAIELAEYIKAKNLHPEQVQDFYPTPFTISTCMFYTGLDPFTLQEVYVPRDFEEKRMQRALLQFSRPENYTIVLRALRAAGRDDLIGYGKKCLIRPPKTNHKGGIKNVTVVKRKRSVAKNQKQAKRRNRKA